MAVFEIRSQADYWNTVIGSVLTPRCRADFGDAKCGATPTSLAASVFRRASATCASGSTSPDNWPTIFPLRRRSSSRRPLAGTWPYEVVASDGYTGEIEVLAPCPAFPRSVINSCSATAARGSRKRRRPHHVPTCLTHNNVRRFRGFDQVPGHRPLHPTGHSRARAISDGRAREPRADRRVRARLGRHPFRHQAQRKGVGCDCKG
jgi:hypothetical protein